MSNPTAIRLSVTKEVAAALHVAKRRYPTLSDPEILKLGLAKIVSENNADIDTLEREAIRRNAAYAVGSDYLADSEEDIYTSASGKKVHFS